ncbi:hypothetical protein [Methylococcus sp. EFPC2]|uniref:hypothetical protein n=1 Tax=Methylococcus sp. EFPC2 TaxID=2812648 RepID=UPI001967FDCA|nr:hypothetical protein [Methylococcus sp. EFPC2]QSA97686.1 hypothetical protein JWZ97_02280 [Methylococcus sp. EFPC2]
MSKIITIKLADRSPEHLVGKARNQAGQNGLNFTGDVNTGHFHGRGLEGRYHIHGDHLRITILRKPLILPWSLVETTIHQFFA